MADLSSDLASLRIDRNPKPSPGGSGWLKGVLWAVGLGAVGLGVYVTVLPALSARFFRAPIQVTEVASISPAEASIELTATGYVAAYRTSKIAPKVSGRVAKVYVTQGQRVEEGAPLIELDPTDERAAILAGKSRYAAANARTRSAQAQVATIEAQIAEAVQLAEREKRLATEGLSAGGAAQDLALRVKSLEATRSAAQATARAAAAEAASAQADIDVLEVQLRNLTLLSPIAGTVMKKPPQLGEFVGPQPAGLSVDMGGITIADFSTLQVEVDVPEQRLHLVKLGGPTEIVLDAYPSKRLRGRAFEITPTVDRSKATVMVKINFVDRFDGILPEMSARVSFLAGELDADAIKQPPKIVVPESAVTERDGNKVVFVLEGDVVRVVPVQLGAPFGRGFELTRGPVPGTRLVATPAPTLVDGQKIKEESGS
jgi:HlyD family secretion protein